MTARIDLHHHVVPPGYLQALHDAGVDSVDGSRFPAWHPGLLADHAERFEITRAVLSVSAPGVAPLPTGRRGEVARLCNEALAGLVQQDPAGRGMLATLPLPDIDASLTEIEYAFDVLQADGVLLLTNAAGVYLSDDRCRPVLAELDRRAAVALVHPAIPPGAGGYAMALPPAFLEFGFDTVRTAVDLVLRGCLDAFPRIRFVLAHAGGGLPFLAGRLAMLDAAAPGRFPELERSGRPVVDHLRRYWYDSATCGPEALALTAGVVGADRVVFGTDLPWSSTGFVERTLRAVEHSELLTDDDRATFGDAAPAALLASGR